MIRFIEGYVAFLPVAFVFLLLIMTVGRSHIFPWTHVAPPVPEKRFYLAPAFLIPRDLIMFAIATGLALWFIYPSVRLDVGVVPEAGAKWAAGIRARMREGFGDERRELHTTHSLQGKLAVFMVLAFGYFGEIMSCDLSMTLDMHFQSTLYGWWSFMGAWLGALTAFALLTVVAEDAAGGVDHRRAHFHDIGKLCFAFTAFWGYLTFGQYLVIWYGNMGEETHCFRLRLIHPWQSITTAAVVLIFLFPFFGLLSRAAKVYLPTLTLFAACSLIGIWLQRYIEVYPSLYGRVGAGAARRPGARCDAAVSRHLGPLLLRLHGRVPEDADRAPDVALPRRGPGPRRSADHGAAAGDRIAFPASGRGGRIGRFDRPPVAGR